MEQAMQRMGWKFLELGVVIIITVAELHGAVDSNFCCFDGQCGYIGPLGSKCFYKHFTEECTWPKRRKRREINMGGTETSTAVSFIPNTGHCKCPGNTIDIDGVCTGNAANPENIREIDNVYRTTLAAAIGRTNEETTSSIFPPWAPMNKSIRTKKIRFSNKSIALSGGCMRNCENIDDTALDVECCHTQYCNPLSNISNSEKTTIASDDFSIMDDVENSAEDIFTALSLYVFYMGVCVLVSSACHTFTRGCN